MRRRRPTTLSPSSKLADCLFTTFTVQLIALCLSIFVAVPLAVYTFYYPSFHPDLCSWPSPRSSRRDLSLLLFGDPQIRGADKSSSLRTHLDLFGNDHYLGHIYSTLLPRLRPSYVIVLGDLFSSQWISDEEFEVRTRRYKNRLFPSKFGVSPGPVFLNLSGNHDIGYAHDVTHSRVRRFEKHFGQLNFVVTGDDFRIIVFNSMSLDGSLNDNENGQAGFTTDVRQFLEDQMKVKFTGTTILATHVPLHKPPGICIDKPYFTYYGEKSKGLISEQNMLSEATSQWILDGFFGNGNAGNGVVINGHDHEGCLVRHKIVNEENSWSAVPIATGNRRYQYDYDNSAGSGVLEVTVRSMSGEYGGNAGLLSRTWNATAQDYTFAFSICPFGVQHIWWATYVIGIISACALVIAFIGLPFLDEKARRIFVAGTMTPPILNSDASKYYFGHGLPASQPPSGRQTAVNLFGAGGKAQKRD
ncbi:Metallo-dependent phosphatase-like protein [Lipomyces tetrasporus]